MRERTLRDTDRDYLARAMRVVPPVADLQIALPPGRREDYPADKKATQSLVTQHGLQDAYDGLLAALFSLLPHGATETT
jgi:hypothetical protein